MNNDIRIMSLGTDKNNDHDCYVIDAGSELFLVEEGYKFSKDIIPGRLAPRITHATSTYMKRNIDRIKGIFLFDANFYQHSALMYAIETGKDIPVYASKYTINHLENRLGILNKSHTSYEIIEDAKVIEFSTLKVMPFHVPAPQRSFGFSFETSEGNIIFLTKTLPEYSPNGFAKLMYGMKMSTLLKMASQKNHMLVLDSISTSKIPADIVVNPGVETIIKKLDSNANRHIFALSVNELLTARQLMNAYVKNGKPVAAISSDGSKIIDLKFNEIESLNMSNNSFVKLDQISSHRQIGIFIIFDHIELAEKNDQSIISVKDYIKPQAGDQIVVFDPIHTNADFYTASNDAATNDVVTVRKDSIKWQPGYMDSKMLIKFFGPKYMLPIKTSGKVNEPYKAIVTAEGYVSEKIADQTFLLLRDEELPVPNADLKYVGNIVFKKG